MAKGPAPLREGSREQAKGDAAGKKGEEISRRRFCLGPEAPCHLPSLAPPPPPLLQSPLPAARAPPEPSPAVPALVCPPHRQGPGGVAAAQLLLLLAHVPPCVAAASTPPLVLPCHQSPLFHRVRCRRACPDRVVEWAGPPCRPASVESAVGQAQGGQHGPQQARYPCARHAAC